jgi:hypothetical protein
MRKLEIFRLIHHAKLVAKFLLCSRGSVEERGLRAYTMPQCPAKMSGHRA